MPILRVIQGDTFTELHPEQGTNLRQVILDAGLSPYTQLTRVANCGGRGICATCGVWFEAGEPEPVHWHDKLAWRFGYPRLTCQITVDRDMVIRLLDDKIIWGGRDASRAGQLASDPQSLQGETDAS